MSSILLFIIPLCLFSSCFFVQISGIDTYVVAGHIYCTTTGRGPNEPVNEAGVVFLEDDSGINFFNLDDWLGQTFSNAKGQFKVSGSTGESGDEELYLMIWHRCPKEGTGLSPNKKCRFRVRIDLDQILNDDGPFEVNNLEIYLGKNIAKSGNTILPMTQYGENAIC